MKNLILLFALLFVTTQLSAADREVYGEIFTSQKANQDLTITAPGTGDIYLDGEYVYAPTGNFNNATIRDINTPTTDTGFGISGATATIYTLVGGQQKMAVNTTKIQFFSKGQFLLSPQSNTALGLQMGEVGVKNTGFHAEDGDADLLITADSVDAIHIESTQNIMLLDTVFDTQTADTVPYFDANKTLTSSAVTSTQLGYLDATSSIQTQLDGINGLGFTGVRDGGVVSIGAPTTTFSISDGFGYVVDNTTTPATPTYTKVTWSGLTNVALDDISGNYTEIGINSAGTVIQKVDSNFSNSERRDYIVLGILVHVSHTAIDSLGGNSQIGFNEGLSTIDLGNALGVIKVQGGIITPNGANLNIDLSTGAFYSVGANYGADAKDPNITTTASATVATFFRNYRDGVGGRTLVPGQTAIDVGFYDDGSGTLASVANNQWTVKRLFYFPSTEDISISYGQETFSNLAAAANSITTGSFDLDPSLQAGILLTYIITKGNATDLSDDTESDLIQAGKFGEGTVGGTGATTTNFQSTYENSIAPQIILNSTLNGMEIEDAATPIAASLFSVQTSGATADIFDITAETVTIEVPLAIETNAIFGQIATPSNPTAGKNKLYFKSDNKIYKLDSAGNEIELGTGGGGGGGIPLYLGLVVGDGTDVTNGDADYSTIASAITAASAGDRITLLERTFTETLTVSKEVHIVGSGRGSVIDGTITFSASNSSARALKFGGNITVNNTVVGIILSNGWLATTKTLTDSNASSSGSMYLLLGE